MMSKRRNIVLIMTDQQRHDAAGYAGNADIRTPAIDRLAAEGTVFEQAYTPYPLCVPARTCLLKGRYPDAGMLAGRHALKETDANFVRALRDRGYATAAIGKMHFHPMYADHGFDVMRLAEHDPTQPGCFTEDDYHRELAENGMRDMQEEWQFPTQFAHAPESYRHNLQAETFDLPDEWHSTSWIGREALKFLEQNGDKPYFMWVSFLRPHHPFNPPMSYAAAYEDKELKLPEPDEGWLDTLPAWLAEAYRTRMAHGAYDLNLMDRQLLHKITAYYYASITHIDEWIDRIVDSVDKSNTLLLFTSDHGEYLGFRNRLLKDPQITTDDLARVPLVAVWPDRWAADERVRHPVSLVDLAATILEEAGLDDTAIGGTDGRSLRTIADDRTVYAVAHKPSLNVMVRSGDRKLIWFPERQEGLLYDLAADPGEVRNVYGKPEYREIGEILRWKSEKFLNERNR